MKKSISSKYEINKHGCPVIQYQEGASVGAKFWKSCKNRPRDIISIAGNRNGLVALATWMLALADSDSYLDHQHFDNEVDFGFYHSDSNCELIIERCSD